MRSLSDFAKSGLSFVFGTSLVVALVGWRTSGNVAAMLLTFGIPLSFYAAWGIYQGHLERKVRLKAEMQNTQWNARRRKTRERLEILFGQNVNENPLAHVPVPSRIERRVLLPRDSELAKQRILQGRAVVVNEDEVDAHDQWHS